MHTIACPQSRIAHCLRALEWHQGSSSCCHCQASWTGGCRHHWSAKSARHRPHKRCDVSLSPSHACAATVGTPIRHIFLSQTCPPHPPLPNQPQPAMPARPKPTGPSPSLLDMINAGVIRPGSANAVVTFKGMTYVGNLQPNGTILFQGAGWCAL